MPTVIDIVICIDYTSSIMSYFDQIRIMSLVICAVALTNQDGVRIGIIKFRSCYDRWRTQVYGFTQNINVINQILTGNDLGGTSPDRCKVVGDALHEALNFPWRVNNDDQVFNEKLVILITDGAPNGLFTTLNGADPWIISNKFMKKDITLVVVGVGEGINECDDFYCALAQNTGGQYIPLVNAERILQNIIETVINEETTFHQCLRHVMIEEIEKNSSFKYSYMKDRVNDMIKECQTIDDIRQLFFNHRLSTLS
ncbi:unnamed protein product [Rotaria sp. Silwood2]|nr:unnamed protein product [Rotaria sp. Silwood2]CAF3268435.1 unnamed protein product [Rotaria sp. Silwood2]CAF3983038.1 unnamed protein product [Rotaria sp. Silwood2]CAF4515813.1 unnamed protein product [Rotaria sp. Silwood2]